ncbi:MAG TPA: NUDIX hydrolase [Acidobacteriaceae bacterium]|nr:NUDIX hydrolase [Acidobacteriaceae bacterium]
MSAKKSQKNPPAAPANVKIIKGKLTIRPGKPAPVVSSTTAYQGPLFRVQQEHVREPNCGTVIRDIIRHGGSVVILAIDDASKRDPLVVLERQYRHAASQFLYEVPAGKIDPGENRLAAAKRELAEETGFRARKWTQLARYYASPGFLAEWMQVYLAEGLTPGLTAPDEDERLEIMLVPFSELLRLIDTGQIHDGKTLIAAMSFARLRAKSARSPR